MVILNVLNLQILKTLLKAQMTIIMIYPCYRALCIDLEPVISRFKNVFANTEFRFNSVLDFTVKNYCKVLRTQTCFNANSCNLLY